MKLKVSDVSHGSQIARRAVVLQQKTGRPVQFEITDQARNAVADWIKKAGLGFDDFLFPGRSWKGSHVSTRHYARLVKDWVSQIGLDPIAYGTHSLRRTRASLIYRRTKNLRAAQLLLGHTKLDSTVDTWASKSKTRLRLRNRSRCNPCNGSAANNIAVADPLLNDSFSHQSRGWYVALQLRA